jgi:SSS family solute:Na+ symporter/sodium/proline symporter
MVYQVTVIGYVAILIAISVWLSLRVKTKEDFIVAGRRLTWPILVGTLLATWIGSGSIFGGGTLGYRQGFAALWQPAGAWFGIIVIYFVAGRARRFGQFTVPDLMEARYNATARVLATIATIVSYTIIVSYQFRGGARVIELVFPNVSYETGVLITFIFATVFTVLAGLMSVAYTDIVNGSIIVIATSIAVPTLISSAGGWSEVQANLDPSHFTLLGTMTFKEAMNYFLPTMFLLLGNAGMYQRFFAARDEREARRSVVGWVIGLLLVETLVIALAVVGSSMPQFRNLAASESIIPAVARQGLPVVIGCLMLAAIVAIVLSTANSFLLVPATNVARDVYQRFINPKASERQVLLLSRVSVVLLAALAFLMSMRFFDDILDAVVAAYTIYGASIAPALLAIFFWKRATPAGGTSSIFAGFGIGVIWEVWRGFNLGGTGDFPFGVETIYSSLIASVGSLIVVSLLTPAPQDGATMEPSPSPSR